MNEAKEDFSKWVYKYTCRHYIWQPYTYYTLLRNKELFGEMLTDYNNLVYEKTYDGIMAAANVQNFNDKGAVVFGSMKKQIIRVENEPDKVDYVTKDKTVIWEPNTSFEELSALLDKAIHEFFTQ